LIDAIFAMAGINVSMLTSSLIKKVKVIPGASSLVSPHHLSLGQNFPILSAVPQGSYIASLPLWYSVTMLSWTCFATATRFTKGFSSFILTLTASLMTLSIFDE
jgi:hypothetical protein